MTEAEERLRDAVRLRHFSRHTEKPHVFWLKSKALSVRHSVLSARPKPSEESSSFEDLAKPVDGDGIILQNDVNAAMGRGSKSGCIN